jgi:hypothetical protein
MEKTKENRNSCQHLWNAANEVLKGKLTVQSKTKQTEEERLYSIITLSSDF